MGFFSSLFGKREPEPAPPADDPADAIDSEDGAERVDALRALVERWRSGDAQAAERVPKKDKLLKLSIDLGEATPRIIVSGVAQSYAPEELVGKVVCVVANLPPRDFGKGLASHGMVLYASGGDREHTAIELPSDVKPGSTVK